MDHIELHLAHGHRIAIIQPAIRFEHFAANAPALAIFIQPRNPEPVRFMRAFNGHAQFLGEHAGNAAVIDVAVGDEQFFDGDTGLFNRCTQPFYIAARIDELNKECDARWQRRLDVRMGLDSGEIVAGLFGGNRLANYSVAGPAVDFARRLCSASSSYGARILIGPDAYSPAAESLEVRPIEILKVSARRRRVEIYEILTAKHGLSPERERSRDHFWTGVLHYREKQWEKAVDEFTKARITGLPDPALDFYLRRIEQSRRLAEDSHKESMPAFQHNA
jgi:class 3 adenylate cyclase